MSNDWQGNDPLDNEVFNGGSEAQEDESINMDLLTRGGGSFDEFAPPKKSGSTGVLVLLLAGIVGGGALWAMRVAGSTDPVSTVGSEAEQQIEAALARLSSTGGEADDDEVPLDPAGATRHALDVLFRDTDEVIAMFADDPTSNQVGLEELQKNPFELMIARRTSNGDDEPEADPVDEAERQRQQRLARLETEYGRLSLQSVLTGDPSLAVIDNEVVRVGETVGSFEVVAISRQGVRLIAEGETFTLELAQPDDGRSPRR